MASQSVKQAAASGEDAGASVAAKEPGGGPVPPAVMIETFIRSIERLEQILELETQLLRQHRQVALRDFNHRKSHGLLEFSRSVQALRALDPAAVDLAAQAPLGRLRAKLDENLAILKSHLDAVGEIAAIVARAMQEQESDGTYAPMTPGAGGAR
jgi:hypothetical protein